MGEAADEDIEQVLKSVTDNGLETVRIVFVDQHGITRGKTLMASALEGAFKNGVSMTSTLLLKDTSHATVFPVWADDAGFGKGVMTGASDFIMKPDPATFQILPWAKKTGWMISDIFHQDGSAITFSTRRILQDAVARLRDKDMAFVCGLEVEFYVLKIEDSNLRHENENRPHDPPVTSLLSHGYQYLTENRVDELDEVMGFLQVNAQELGLGLRSMESEFGPSQFEFTFEPVSAIEAADNMVLFRNMVKQVCRRHGYHGTFMCRPDFKNSMGSGWHLHQSVIDTGTGNNLFIPDTGNRPDCKNGLSSIASKWIGGLLHHARASCILTTPTVNGYKRYQPFALAPDRIQWGHDNRGAMLRYLGRAGDEASRVENRVGEPAANPYLYIASQILSGIDGIENDRHAPQAVEQPYQGEGEMLPDNLSSALGAFSGSAFYREVMGDGFVDYYTHIKQAEWQRYLGAVSRWEHTEYFSTF